MVRVRLFAAPREAVGAGVIDVPLAAGATAESLLLAAAARHPALTAWQPLLRVAVNRRIVGPADPVREGDEVAFLPPVSGGSVDFGDDLSVDRALLCLAPAGAGAAVAFLGLARPDGGTRRLEFEAYEAMALVELARIEHDAREKFGLLDVLIRHRLGVVPVGEPAILVAVLARHRREAFDAAAWIMDEVKASVAIWKKEVGDEAHWVHPGGLP